MMRSGLILPLCAVVLGCLGCQGRPPPIEAATVPTALPSALSSTAAPLPPTASVVPSPEPPSPTAPEPAPPALGKVERRCGWVDNPTPANWWLVDKDGTWEIGVQGGYQADGEMPDFGAKWVETNGHYGYGCACMDVRLDRATARVIAYRAVKTLPIERCRKDRKLPRR